MATQASQSPMASLSRLTVTRPVLPAPLHSLIFVLLVSQATNSSTISVRLILVFFLLLVQEHVRSVSFPAPAVATLRLTALLALLIIS